MAVGTAGGAWSKIRGEAIALVRPGAQGPAATLVSLDPGKISKGNSSLNTFTLQGLISLPHSNFPGSFSLNWS